MEARNRAREGVLAATRAARTGVAAARARVPSRAPHSRPVYAKVYGVVSRRADRSALGTRRRALLAGASGRVLDVGAGPGLSFPHLPRNVTRLVALEPDSAMVDQARPRAGEARAPVHLLRAVAEQMPFPDRSFDTVVATLVLCTVDDLHCAMNEIHRVLRPGGRLLFMEHVRASDEALAGWQDRVQRVWSRCNGGCQPNRATLDLVRRAGFRLGRLELYGFPVLPHVQGEAVRD